MSLFIPILVVLLNQALRIQSFGLFLQLYEMRKSCLLPRMSGRTHVFLSSFIEGYTFLLMLPDLFFRRIYL